LPRRAGEEIEEDAVDLGASRRQMKVGDEGGEGQSGG
jgi:hypothetical protein